MRATFTIARRELRSYFQSPVAYIVLSVFMIVTGFLFFDRFFSVRIAKMDALFSNLPFIFLFFGPALAMRLLAEERGSGTIELLLTMPVRDWEVVLGKYLAALALLAVGLLGTVPFAITIGKLGNLDVGPVVTGYLGAVLLGGLYLAAGLFASSLTRNQVVAFVIGLLICFALFLVEWFVDAAGSTGGRVLQYLSPQFHFSALVRGIVELRGLLYFGSGIGLLLLYSVQVLEARKWR
jgi:ABC-2 type transport system permease protein